MTPHMFSTSQAGQPLRACRAAPAQAVLLLCLALQGTVWAQGTAPAPVASAATPTFAIKGFRISGENPLGAERSARVLAPFVQANATINTLQEATAALEKALRDAGYGLHRVALPPQEVGDTVALEIIRFAIGKVLLEGAGGGFDEANIRRSLPELKEGATPNFRHLAVQTAIANENQGKQVQVSLKESDEPDRIDAKVLARVSKPWNLAVSLNNTGTSASGTDRLTVSGGHSNLFGLDHQFVGAYTTSVQRMSDVRQIGLSYRIPLYALGGVVGISYTKSDVVGNFGAFSSTGAGNTMGVNYTHYLPPNGGYRGYFTFGLDNKQFDVTAINGVPIPGQQMRRSRPLSAGYTARSEFDGGVWGYNTELVSNASGGTGNDLASYQSEDPRITTSRWRALRASGHYSTAFGDNWILGLRAQMQFSGQALISAEQFGLGGSASVRGTAERALSGDKGMLGSVEVTSPELAPGLRLAGFVDTGVLQNNQAAGTAKLESDRLSSAGLGLRFASQTVSLTVDYGRIVRGSNLSPAVNAAAPKTGDEKIHVSLSVRF